jgi:hypothetical protein
MLEVACRDEQLNSTHEVAAMATVGSQELQKPKIASALDQYSWDCKPRKGYCPFLGLYCRFALACCNVEE